MAAPRASVALLRFTFPQSPARRRNSPAKGKVTGQDPYSRALGLCSRCQSDSIWNSGLVVGVGLLGLPAGRLGVFGSLLGESGGDGGGFNGLCGGVVGFGGGHKQC